MGKGGLLGRGDGAPRFGVTLVDYRGKRPYGLRWRHGDRRGEISTGEYRRDPAVAKKYALLERLAAGELPGRVATSAAITWRDFRRRYEEEWLVSMSPGSKGNWRSTANHLEAICRPRLLAGVDKAMLLKFRAGLEARKISPFSLRSYYASLRAALGWAKEEGLIDSAPSLRLRRLGVQQSTLRTRSITEGEFARMLDAARELRGDDQLARFMQAMWLTGLRVGECAKLSKLTTSPAHVDVQGELSLIVFVGGQKNGADACIPAPPAFWRLVAESFTDAGDLVFPVTAKRTGAPVSSHSIAKMISKAGAAAKVVVNRRTGKTAGSHDLRASCLTGLSDIATQSQMLALARHSDMATTTKFYLRHEAQRLAESLGWV